MGSFFPLVKDGCTFRNFRHDKLLDRTNIFTLLVYLEVTSKLRVLSLKVLKFSVCHW